jgi:hypothetical protein
MSKNKPINEQLPIGRFTSADMDRITAAISGLDHIADTLELTWGVGRLELLVSDLTRSRFLKQRRNLDQALEFGTVADIEVHAAGMVRAWQAIDTEAKAGGMLPLDPNIWEIRLADGSVVHLVRTITEAHKVAREGRRGSVWSLDEIGNIISNHKELIAVKEVFPGATVSAARTMPPPDWVNGDGIPF